MQRRNVQAVQPQVSETVSPAKLHEERENRFVCAVQKTFSTATSEERDRWAKMLDSWIRFKEHVCGKYISSSTYVTKVDRMQFQAIGGESQGFTAKLKK